VPETRNPPKAFQLDSLLMAPGFWAEVDAASGLASGYGATGRLQPVADAAALDLAQARAASSAALWPASATWQVVAAGAGPFEPLSASGWLIRDSLSARLHPRRAVDSLAAALAARGVPILTDAPAMGVTLWATGAAGLADLSEALGRPVGRAVRGQAALMGHDARGAPQLFAGAVHIVPHADGTTAVGSVDSRDDADPTATDDRLEALIARARVLVPALAGAPVLQRWAGLRPRARSRAPMLGHWPDRPDHYIANGGFKIGFGMAPKVAETMAALILDGTDLIPQGFRVEDNL
jgi:glycine oxidase